MRKNFKVNQRRSAENSYVTCGSRGDGVGGQLLAVLSAMVFARDMGMQYVHTPFRVLAHNDNQDPDWERKWESFLNLGDSELKIEDLDQSALEQVNIIRPRKFRKKANMLLNVVHCNPHTNAFPEHYQYIRPEIRRRYENGSRDQLINTSSPPRPQTGRSYPAG
ncbi:hypothetical protein ACFL4W_05660 [Planctomycetota bacterium]